MAGKTKKLEIMPETQLRRMADDIYELKRRYFDIEFARNSEIKGKELFKNYVFALQKKGIASSYWRERNARKKTGGRRSL